MTLKERLAAAIRQQEQIVAASRAAGNETLTADEQRDFDAQQGIIDELRAQIEIEEREANEAAVRTAAATAERQRISEIGALCREFGIGDAETRAMTDDANCTVEAARERVLNYLRQHHQPNGVGVRVTEDEQDKFRAAAADALCMRAGVNVASPARGAADLRSFSLRDIAEESLEREGRSAAELRRMDAEELLRQFANPTAAFNVILDNAVNKSIVELYKLVPTTFERFTSKGSLSDFKESRDNEYVLGQFGEFPIVPESGELEADTITAEKLPTRALDTRGKAFSMTRQAFINDDVGFIAQIPGAFARADKMTIETEVYRKLLNNAAIFDGKTLFHADHHNLIGSGAAPSVATIEAAMLLGYDQTDHNGNPIMWMPKFLITGTGYEFTVRTILHSQHLPGTANNDINPLYNMELEHVQSPVLKKLAGANACPWFLAADPMFARGIQVDYLNGVEIPTIRRSEKAGVLGFVWDVWHDWRVNVVDWRGLVKNPGAVIS